MNKKRLRLSLSIISLIIFLAIMFFVLIDFTAFDKLFNNFFYNINNTFLNSFFIFLGNYLKIILIAIAIAFVILLYFKKRKKESLILFFSLLIGYLLEEIIKFLVHRARPINQLVLETDYSFPSGHSIYVIILFSLLIYFYRGQIKNKLLRITFISINVFLILLVGFSRIYLGVHWFTDVIGGYAMGFFIFNFVLFLSQLFIKKSKAKH